MKDNWKDIQNKIRESEEPLKAESWNTLDSLLTKKRKRWTRGLLFILLFASFSAWLLWTASSNFTNKEEAENLTDNQKVETEKLPAEKPITPTANLEEQNTASNNLPDTYSNKKTKIEARTVQNDGSSKRNINRNEGIKEIEPAEINSPLSLASKSFEFDVDFNIPNLRSTQESTSPKNPKEKKSNSISRGFELRISAGSNYTPANNPQESESQKVHKDFAKASANSLLPEAGFQAGIELRYTLFPGFKIGSGLGYQRINIQKQYDYTITDIPVIDGASGNIIAYIPAQQNKTILQSGSNSYQYLSIPITLYKEYKLSEKLTLTGELIHHLNFLINQSSTNIDVTTLEVQDVETDSFSKSLIGYQLRLGLQYHLNTRMSLAFEPSYRSFYSNIYAQDNLSWQPKSFSLNLSAIIKLPNPKLP